MNMADNTPVAIRQKLVHLDLKGAAPNIGYLSQIFALVKSFGATGLLIEYEDMFPYRDQLHKLPTSEAYSVDDIRQICEMAELNDLEVIPLVQTFGHMEFVLKHLEFSHLREVPLYPMTLCPLHEGSLTVINELVKQMLELHPEAKWLHIGADEVFNLGQCSKCLAAKQSTNGSEHLFLQHISRIVDIVRTHRPDVRVIMWDDMLRSVDPQTLSDYNLGDKVDLMVWYYGRSIDLPAEVWDKYTAVFPSIWVASAFKGATRPNAYVTDIGYHVDNHLAWLNLLRVLGSRIGSLQGIAITGWQRYDHYAALCELLPVALPCLALCLAILHAGNFSEDLYTEVSGRLGFQVPFPLSPQTLAVTDSTSSFPGCDIYQKMCIFSGMKTEYQLLVDSDRLSTWMADYHVKRNFTNPVHMEAVLYESNRLLDNLRALRGDLQATLLKVFSKGTVEEWVDTFMSPLIDRCQSLCSTAQQQLIANTYQPPSS